MSEENKTQETKLYELGYHLTSAIPEDKVSAKIDEIKKILVDNGAKIVKEGEPKLMKLAYQIVNHIAGKNHRFNNAYFAWIKFNATSKGVESIKTSINAMDEIIRSLIIKTVDDDEHSTAKILNEDVQEEVENLEDSTEEVEVTETDEEIAEVEEKELENPKEEVSDEK